MSKSTASGSPGPTVIPVAAVFKRLLDQLTDARCIVVSSPEGAELYSVAKGAGGATTLSQEDAQTIGGYVPAYAASVEQAKRLGSGDTRYAVAWVSDSAGASCVLVQTAIDGSVPLVVSLLCDEGGNLGVLDEFVATIHTVLSPLCQGFQLQQGD